MMFASKEHLKRHNQSEHRPKRPAYLCSTCNYASATASAMEEHKRRHAGIEAEGGAARRTRGQRREGRPVERVHRGRHKCRFCQYSSDHTTHVRDHERVHTGERPYVCAVCTKGFTSKRNLGNHSKTVHEGQRNYGCSVCGYTFTQKIHLQRHAQRLHSVQD
ncbi:zinc finger protein 211-like [Ornithodoros turicata]|uniref:zinc finger protein 211-like n=1 Tax=Ornithodoros turicata TaxID=34597 RepID=UPI003138BD91